MKRKLVRLPFFCFLVIQCFYSYQLDEEIEKMGGNKAGVFVRLSSRSPKDSVQDNLFNLYLQEKASLLNEGNPPFHLSSIYSFSPSLSLASFFYI